MTPGAGKPAHRSETETNTPATQRRHQILLGLEEMNHIGGQQERVRQLQHRAGEIYGFFNEVESVLCNPDPVNGARAVAANALLSKLVNALAIEYTRLIDQKVTTNMAVVKAIGGQ